MRRASRDIPSIYVIGARGLPNVQGGIEKFCSKLYPLLVKRKYDVTILTVKKYTADQCLHWNGLNIKPVYSVNNTQTEKLVYNIFSTIYCLYKRPDIVHIHSVASGTFVFILRFFRIKVLCRYNSRDYLYPKWGKLAKLILKFGEYNFFLSNYVICNSREYMKIFQPKMGPDRLCFIPNGIEFEKKEYSKIESVVNGINIKPYRYILSVGRITPEKGFDLLLDAFEMIREKEDLILLIVGDYDINDPYTHKLCVEHDTSNVVFAGYIDQDHLRDIYFNCSLYVSSSRFEGMSNSVLEAIGYGCKVLLSDIPGNMQLFINRDSYFRSGDKFDLADKILEINNDETTPDYSHLVNTHDWNNIADRIDQINKEL